MFSYEEWSEKFCHRPSERVGKQKTGIAAAAVFHLFITVWICDVHIRFSFQYIMGGIVTIRILIRIGETKRETGPLPLFRLRSAFRTQAAVHFYHRQSSVRSGFRIAFHHTLRRIYLLACGQQADASIRLSGTFGGVSDPNSFFIFDQHRTF